LSTSAHHENLNRTAYFNEEKTMTRITGATRRDDTIQRLGGNGDNWYPTWGADGSLYVALCDGTGFPGMPRRNNNSRLIRIEGTPETGLTFHDVPGYPELGYPIRGEFDNTTPGTRLGIRYYGFGTISVDGTIYQYLNTWPVPVARQSGVLPRAGRIILAPGHPTNGQGLRT
jgi:hypothetical protein